MPLANVQDLIRILHQEIAALNKLNTQFRHDRSLATQAEKVKLDLRLREIRAELTMLLESSKTEAGMTEAPTPQDSYGLSQ